MPAPTDVSQSWDAYDADRAIAAQCADPRVLERRAFHAGVQAAALLMRDRGTSPQSLLAQVAAFGRTVGTAAERASA